MKKFILLLLLCSWSADAAIKKSQERSFSDQSSWMLNSYLALAEGDPSRLIQLAREQFSPEALKRAKQERSLSFAWQDRMAILGGLSQLFNPEGRFKVSRSDLKIYRKEARGLIEQCLRKDTSLLVRDGAVETIRRIIRMRPSDSKIWKRALESAFMDRQNIIDGEGLFIRETLLNAIREANLPLSMRIRRSAEMDQNPKVKRLLRLWKTRTFDTF